MGQQREYQGDTSSYLFSTSDNPGYAERFLQYNLEVKLRQENYES